MRFIAHSHRNADLIFENREEFKELWGEVCDVLGAISEDDIIVEFESGHRDAKSISQAINRLIKKELVAKGWVSESYIFADKEYGPLSKGTWRLDFAKGRLCVEVAFNHRSDIAWNLIKPTLAAELNHVLKAMQADGGIIITATQAMKAAGGYDNAIGTFEDYVQYLKPMSQILTAPLMIVGLLPPKTFAIALESRANRKVGHVIRFFDETIVDDIGQTP